MASKTVTRSIPASAWKSKSILGDSGTDSGSKGKSKRMQKKKKKPWHGETVPFFAIRLSLVPTICPWVSEDAEKGEGAMGRGTRREKPFLIFPFPIVSRAFLTNNRRVDWKKKADVSRHHFWRSQEMTYEERMQRFDTDDTSLPRSG